MRYVVSLEYRAKNTTQPFRVQVHESGAGFSKESLRLIYSKKHKIFTRAFEDADWQKEEYGQEKIVIEQEK